MNKAIIINTLTLEYDEEDYNSSNADGDPSTDVRPIPGIDYLGRCIGAFGQIIYGRAGKPDIPLPKPNVLLIESGDGERPAEGDGQGVEGYSQSGSIFR